MTASRVRGWLVLCCCLLLVACVSRPDLARLYENDALAADQPPVIVIHGLAGSTLVDAQSGKQFWPGSLSTLTFSNYRDLAQMSTEDREGEGLVPGDLFYTLAGVDFYGEVLRSLERVGHFKRGVPGKPVGAKPRHYYVLLYDWRKDNMLAVRKLHALIEQIRIDYGDPGLRVDIVAHSNGGTIANYYLRYGPDDVLDSPAPVSWAEGDLRVRRLVMLGTPALGAVTSLERLIYGTKMAVRTVPVEVMATFATPFQALPHPLTRPIIDAQGKPAKIDIYDDAVWRSRRWGVFSGEVGERVVDSMPSRAEGEKALQAVQATFSRNLRRAERLHWSLSGPFPAPGVEIAVFGGDCELTPARAVLLDEPDRSRLVFRPAQVGPRQIGGKGRRQSAIAFERLMFAPGDGLVTRASQVGRDPTMTEEARDQFHPLPVSQTFFLCESHGRLTHNLYFQNNLLFFLLSR